MISLEDIRNLAQLARLKLTADEEESLQKDISGILDYVGQVSVAGADASPSLQGDRGWSGEASAPAPRNVMREDVPYEGTPLGKREDLINAFPKRQGDFNEVRKIIDKDAE